MFMDHHHRYSARIAAAACGFITAELFNHNPALNWLFGFASGCDDTQRSKAFDPYAQTGGRRPQLPSVVYHKTDIMNTKAESKGFNIVGFTLLRERCEL